MEPDKLRLLSLQEVSAKLIREDSSELLHDLFLGMCFCDREFFHQKAPRRIEHLAFAKRQFLVALEDEQIAQDLGDFEWRTRLDLFGVLPVSAVPGLGVAFHFLLAEDLINLGDSVLTDNPPQPDRFDILGRNHDGHFFGAKNAEHIKSALRSRDNPALNIFDNRDAMRRVNDLFTLLKRQIHLPLGGSFSSG
jgi:hypothetical protein